MTPVQCTIGTRHPVTHWKSLTSLVGGIACRSASVKVMGRSTMPVDSQAVGGGARGRE